MKNKRKVNSVKNLSNLYTVVIGVALSLAIIRLINPEDGLHSITLSTLLLFIAFFVTLFPFYHGALRHLDDAYIENSNLHINDLALVFDLVLLIVHGVVFVVLSLLLNNPGHFIWVLVILLFIDVIWGIFAHYGFSSKDKNTAEWKWAAINIVFVIIAGAYLLCNGIYIQKISNHLVLPFFIAGACILRTLVDYIWCRTFYFPKQ